MAVQLQPPLRRMGTHPATGGHVSPRPLLTDYRLMRRMAAKSTPNAVIAAPA
jgi:hypothetical protein